MSIYCALVPERAPVIHHSPLDLHPRNDCFNLILWCWHHNGHWWETYVSAHCWIIYLTWTSYFCIGRTQDIFQTIVKGRKSWKTLRGNGEAVWPPELEAALLEGECLWTSFSNPRIYIRKPRTRKISTRRFKRDKASRPVPHAQPIYIGLHISRYREAQDGQASRKSFTAA